MTDSSDRNTPWLAHYPAGIDWAMNLQPQSLVALFDTAAQRFAARPCLDFLGRRFTYAQVASLVNRTAKGFQDLGVRPGVKVGLCLPNTPYYVICYFAVLKAGGTVVNFNPLYAEREIAYQIEDSQTDIMVTLDLKQVYRHVGAMLGTTRLKRIVVCPMCGILPTVKGLLFKMLKRSELACIPDDEAHLSFERLLANDAPLNPVSINPTEDVAVLQYTGGTTGVPKGAMLTHANLTCNTQQALAWFSNLRVGEERMLAALPFFHVFAMTVVMNFGLASGMELILLPRFEVKQLLETIARRQPTLFPGVPTMYKALICHPDAGRYPLTSIRYCISGGAPLPVELKHQFEAITGCVLVEGYGLTEASPVSSANPLLGVNKEGSIGLPLPGVTIEIRSLEDPSKTVPLGEKGEVVIAGPHVMRGYWKRPEDTAQTIIDGFLHTGDVGVMDEDGYIFLMDRLKDLIISGGYNIYPRVIEEAIYQHPEVDAVTVIGVPDDYRGQSPKAFVQRSVGSTLTVDALKTFLNDKLSRIEMPKHIEFRNELPKTIIGKLSKKELIAEENQKWKG